MSPKKKQRFARLKALAAQHGVVAFRKGKHTVFLKGVVTLRYNMGAGLVLIQGANSAAIPVPSDLNAILVAAHGPLSQSRVITGKLNRVRRTNIKAKLLQLVDTCRWCNTPLDSETATIEHVIPLAIGGTNKQANLDLSCDPCNNRRGSDMSWEPHPDRPPFPFPARS